MTTKNIAKAGIAAALIAMAPLAFAQTTGTDTSNTSGGPANVGNNIGAYNPTGSAAANTSGTSGATTNSTSGTSGTSGTTGTSGSTTPGVPNTGAGGDATMNIIVLTASGIVALGGLAYIATRRKEFNA